MVEPSTAFVPAARSASPARMERSAFLRPRLSAVIVNYRSWADTARLARTLLGNRLGRRGALEVVVVDNHSPRHPLAARLRRWRGLSMRCFRRNRGFAQAVNEGCRLARGDWFLVLNPDVTVPRHFAAEVLGLAESLSTEQPRAGIVGFQLRDTDGARQQSFGEFPTLPGLLARLLLPRARRKYSRRQIIGRSEVPWVTGCCWLVRRACLEDLGGLDERFFLYYEDVDFCRRARQRGWSVWFEPGLWAKHHRPLHLRTPCPSVHAFVRHALLTYAALHWPAWQRWLLGGVVGMEAWIRQLAATSRRDAWVYRELGALARSLACGREQDARKRLEKVVDRFTRSAR